MNRWTTITPHGAEHAFTVRDDLLEPEPDDVIVSRCGHATARRADVEGAPERPTGRGCAFCRRVMAEAG